MSIWKGGAKKTKRAAPSAPTLREVVPLEAASVLPDVVAGLTLGSSTISSRTGGITKGFSSHFSDVPDPESESRREPRPRRPHQPNNAQHGLETAAASYYMSQPCFELSSQSPAQDNWSKGDEALPSWNDTVSMATQAIEFSHQPNTSSMFYPDSQYPVHSGQITIQDVRLRSMSSDPHGYRNERNKEQRARCSSATRCRQPRFKPKCVIPEDTVSIQTGLNCTNIDAEPTSPSNSRIFARIDYQETVSSPQTESGVPSRRKVKQSRAEIAQARAAVNESSNEMSQQNNMNADNNNSYGYQIPDLEALLTEATPNRPANLPMVLSSPSRLHNMRRTQENQTGPIRPFLPLGIIVNAVFKTRDWLYIRTAHGAEGYVPFRVCLPLGILPQNRGISSSGSATLNPSNCASPWELRGNEGISTPCPATKRNSSNTNESLVTLQRGRNRERRRVTNVSSNQTDMQKLQPVSVDGVVEAQIIEQRVNIPSTSRGYNIPHYV